MGVLRPGLGGLCVALLSAACATASAWNPAQWGGELITGYVSSTADLRINRLGDEIPIGLYEKTTLQSYGVVGLTDRIAVVGSYDRQTAQIEVGEGIIGVKGPSAISAGLQYQLHRSEGRAVAVSVSYYDGIDLPLSLLSLESREPAVELRGLWGESRTLLGRNVFAEAQVAGRMTTEGRLESTRGQFTVGAEVYDRAQIIGKLRYTAVEADIIDDFEFFRRERIEVEAAAVFRVWRQSYVELGYQGTVSADNAVLESGYKAGMWVKF